MFDSPKIHVFYKYHVTVNTAWQNIFSFLVLFAKTQNTPDWLIMEEGYSSVNTTVRLSALLFDVFILAASFRSP